MKLYKLTDQQNMTRTSTKWGNNVTHTVDKIYQQRKPELCSNNVIHAYKNKNLAILLNPIHANLNNPALWVAKGNPVVEDYGKVGCFSVTTVKAIRLPAWVNSKKDKLVRVRFAILCAEAALKTFEAKFPNDNRPKKAIKAAKEYLKKPSADAAAHAADAAHAAAHAADAAAHAAYAAAHAAYAAAHADFGVLANTAVKLIMNKEQS